MGIDKSLALEEFSIEINHQTREHGSFGIHRIVTSNPVMRQYPIKQVRIKHGLLCLALLSTSLFLKAQVDPNLQFDDISKTYGDPDFTLAATSISTGTIEYLIIPGGTGSATLSGTNDEDVTLGSAGTVIIRASLDPDGIYNGAQKDITLTINQKTLTVTGVVANNKVYDASTDATLDIASANLVGVESADVSNVSLATPTGTFSQADVGTGITVSSNLTLTGSAADNYSLTQPTGLTADITQKTLTVTGVVANNKVYNASTDATLDIASANLVGVESADVSNVSLTSPTGTFSQADVGTGITVSSNLTLTGSAADNYSLTQPTGLTADITQKALTVTGVVANNKVYDASTDATLDIASANLVGVESADVSNVSLASPTGTFSQADVGTGITLSSNLTLTGSAADNYSLTQPTGLTADITQKALTVTGVVANNKVYDASTDATLDIASANLVGVESADVSNVSLASPTGTFSQADVGTGITLSSNLTLTGSAADNYSLTQTTGLTADITQKTLTVTGVVANNKVYDASTDATLDIASANLVGVESADVSNVSLASPTGTFSQADVGTGITLSSNLTLTGSAADNYSLTQPTGLTADITQKALTVTGVVANNKVYDASTDATLDIASANLVGVESADVSNVSLASPTGTFSQADVGTGITLSSNLTLTGSAADNYSLTQTTGLTADITQKTLTVTGVVANNKVYDASTDATLDIASANLVGVESADVSNVSLASPTGTFSQADVGTGITLSSNLTLTGSAADNYSLTQPTGLTADITQKALTVTGVVANNKVYDASTDATLDIASANLVGVESADVSNVSLASPTGTFSQADVGTGITVSSNLALTGSAADNYSLTQPTGLTADITQKALTVTGTVANNKVYDASTDATLDIASANLVGVESADVSNVSLASPTGTFSQADVGTGITVSSNLTLTGSAADNYSLTQPTLSADITKASLTATATTVTTFFGDNPSLGPTYTGFAGGDTEEDLDVKAVVTGYTVCDPAGTYALTFSTSGSDNNYDITNVNGTLTITSVSLSVSGLMEACDDSTLTITANSAEIPQRYFWYDTNDNLLNTVFDSIYQFPAAIEQPVTKVSYENTNGCLSDTTTFSVEIISNPSTPTFTGKSNICVQDTIQTYSTSINASGYEWTLPSGGEIIGSNTGISLTVDWDSIVDTSPQLQLRAFNQSASGITTCNNTETRTINIRNDVRNFQVSEVLDSFVCYANTGEIQMDTSLTGYDYLLAVNGSTSTASSDIRSGNGDSQHWESLVPGNTYSVVQRVPDCGDYTMPGAFTLSDGTSRRPIKNQESLRIVPDSNWVASGDIIQFNLNEVLGEPTGYIWEFGETGLTSNEKNPFMVFNIEDDILDTRLGVFYLKSDTTLACKESYDFSSVVTVEDVNGLFDFSENISDDSFQVNVKAGDVEISLFPNPTFENTVKLNFSIEPRQLRIKAFTINALETYEIESIEPLEPGLYKIELNFTYNSGEVYILQIDFEQSSKPFFISGIRI